MREFKGMKENGKRASAQYASICSKRFGRLVCIFGIEGQKTSMSFHPYESPVGEKGRMSMQCEAGM